MSTTPPDGPLGRLAALVASNDRLQGRLATLAARRRRALTAAHDGNLRVVGPYLGRVADERRGVLARLRANRIEAREFLGAAR